MELGIIKWDVDMQALTVHGGTQQLVVCYLLAFVWTVSLYVLCTTVCIRYEVLD